MKYFECLFSISSQEQSDLLLAVLPDLGFDGFQEEEGRLLAYVPDSLFDGSALSTIANQFEVRFEYKLIAEQNWNAIWESNFQPVFIHDVCTIRADFHTNIVVTGIEIVINPKMSFGTGHHATTMLMLTAMHDHDISNKSVLDFGTGTGILAIYAEKSGADTVLAIDCDEWSIKNACENFETNACSKIELLNCSIGDLSDVTFDCILANINRQILVENVGSIFDRLSKGGLLLISGILNSDKNIILDIFQNFGFRNLGVKENENWISIEFEKE